MSLVYFKFITSKNRHQVNIFYAEKSSSRNFSQLLNNVGTVTSENAIVSYAK